MKETFWYSRVLIREDSPHGLPAIDGGKDSCWA